MRADYVIPLRNLLSAAPTHLHASGNDRAQTAPGHQGRCQAGGKERNRHDHPATGHVNAGPQKWLDEMPCVFASGPRCMIPIHQVWLPPTWLTDRLGAGPASAG